MLLPQAFRRFKKRERAIAERKEYAAPFSAESTYRINSGISMSSRGTTLALTVIRQPIPLSEGPLQKTRAMKTGLNTCEDYLSRYLSNLYKYLYKLTLFIMNIQGGFTTITIV